jgi:hypothetical protein
MIVVAFRHGLRASKLVGLSPAGPAGARPVLSGGQTGWHADQRTLRKAVSLRFALTALTARGSIPAPRKNGGGQRRSVTDAQTGQIGEGVGQSRGRPNLGRWVALRIYGSASQS